jgi:cell division inhibitor SulA
MSALPAPASVNPLTLSTLPSPVWRAGRHDPPAAAGEPSGFAALDAVLPGSGWPAGCLTELLCREAGIGELRLLVPLLQRLTQQRRFVILLAPPHIPYAPALASFGIQLDYLIVIQAPNAADRLWAVEQSLRSAGFGALLAWLPQHRTRPEHLRRLQVAAQSAGGPVFLFRELPAQFEASPAPLRLMLLPRPNLQLSVQVLKRRGPVIARPLVLDLPQPVSTFTLRTTPRQGIDQGLLAATHAAPAPRVQSASSTPAAHGRVGQVTH